MSLPPSVPGLAYLADLIRVRGSVVNKIHPFRNMTFREDHNQVRIGHASRDVASLTSAIPTAFRSAELLENRENSEAFHAQHNLMHEVLRVVWFTSLVCNART